MIKKIKDKLINLLGGVPKEEPSIPVYNDKSSIKFAEISYRGVNASGNQFFESSIPLEIGNRLYSPYTQRIYYVVIAGGGVYIFGADPLLRDIGVPLLLLPLSPTK